MNKPFPDTPLNSIRVVMVRTTHSGNIGAAARAMRVMGLYNLYLVAPKTFPSAEAVALASGALDVLEQATVVPTLIDALSDCHLCFATTARARHLSAPILSVKEAAFEAVSIVQENPQSSVAIVFGTERTGLTNEEVDLCQRLMHIPTENSYNSLNVASAIQITAYELRQALLERRSLTEVTNVLSELPSTQQELEGFFSHLETVMIETEFLNPNEPKHLMRRLRLLFARTTLSKNEINILRGILTASQRKYHR